MPITVASTTPPLLSRVPRSARCSGVGTPSCRPNSDDAAVQIVDLSLPARLDVLQHRRLVVVGDLGARRVVDQLLGIRVEHDPLRGRDGLPLVDEAARRARAAAGCSQTRPCVSPVSAPIGFVAALKITLRHCGPRASATARRRHAAARAGVREPLDLGRTAPARPRTGRASCRPSRPTARRRARGSSPPGTSCRGSRARRARASTSSLPIPFCTVATQPSANACAVAAIAGVGVHRLRRDDPEVARRQLGGVGRRARTRPTTSPAPTSRRPSRLIASTCACASVVRPHLDVVERREVRREQRADRAAADDTDSHSQEASLALIKPVHRLVQRHRHAEPVRLAHERAGDHVDLGAAVRRRRPRASTGSARWPRCVASTFISHGSSPSVDARRRGDGLALVHQRRTRRPRSLGLVELRRSAGRAAARSARRRC